MSYRPITDMWFLARAALLEGKKYYGAYLGGFPERARALLAARLDEPVLHVCGGMAKYYKYPRGFGPNDKTLDLDPATDPDYLQDAREPFPRILTELGGSISWPAILIDPPYSEVDAENYKVGSSVYPKPNLLLKNANDALVKGGRVGIIHYILPKAPPTMKFIAAVGVLCGFNNRIRIYSVFEKVE